MGNRKNLLQFGDIVCRVDGEFRIFVGHSFIGKHCYMLVEDFTQNLCAIDREYARFDITKIYRIPYSKEDLQVLKFWYLNSKPHGLDSTHFSLLNSKIEAIQSKDSSVQLIKEDDSVNIF